VKRQNNARRDPHPHRSQRWIDNQPTRAAGVADARPGHFWRIQVVRPFEGAWVADDGREYVEKSYRLEVLVPPERVPEAKALFTRIGKQLGQRAIYFELREGGEIIDLE
jgi:hypothetical protein